MPMKEETKQKLREAMKRRHAMKKREQQQHNNNNKPGENELLAVLFEVMATKIRLGEVDDVLSIMGKIIKALKGA